ncbi:ATP synthase subunit I [Paenibacillus sp. TAB 01]|uniref:ATP synthase subunit I n=1 Tax=Paenibacillus sp. TAB 01 TaxID=3368988 RepID=UPI00375196E6
MYFISFFPFAWFVWAVFVEFRPYAAGIMLGACASMINAKYLAWKIRKLSDKVIAVAADEQKGPYRGNIGFLTRGAIAALAGIAAVRYPQYFSLPTTIAGYFFVQLATLVLGIISIKRSKPQ